MLSLIDDAAIEAALYQPLTPKLKALLATRLLQAQAAGLEDLTHIIVVQSGDDLDTISAGLGFPIMQGPIGEGPFGSPRFTPYWSWLQDLGGWYEMIVTAGNDGFAHLLLIESIDGVPPLLLRMCLIHAGEGTS